MVFAVPGFVTGHNAVRKGHHAAPCVCAFGGVLPGSDAWVARVFPSSFRERPLHGGTFMDHPFSRQGTVLVLLLPFLAGVAGGLAAGPVLPPLAALVLLATLSFALLGAPGRVTAWAVMVLCGLLSAGRIPLADPQDVAPFLGEEVILRGVVEEAKQGDQGWSGIAAPAAIALPDGSRSIRLERVSFLVWKQAESITPGSEIRAQGWLHPVLGRGNPGEFPRELAAVAQRVQYSFFTDAERTVAVAPPASAQGVAGLFRKARERTREWIFRHAGRSDGALYLMSLTTGDVPPPSHPLVVLLRRTGLAHLLAVSGINVAIFHVLVALCIRTALFAVRHRLGTPDLNRTASLLALPGCWAYAFLTGAPIPAVRSAGMLTAGVLLFARLGGRCAGPAWTIMLFATVIAAPHIVVSPSFLLSYAATFFLIVSLGGRAKGHKGEGRARRLLAWGKEAACASAVAFCGTLPVSVAFFSHVPLAAIAWNLFFGPILGTAGVAGAFLAAVGGAFSIDLLGALVAWAAKALCIALWALDVLSRSGWGYVAVPPASLQTALFFTVAAGSGAAALRKRGRPAWPAAVGSAAVFLAWIHHPYLALPEEKLSLTAVNLSRGAACLVSFPGGGHALIDCGSAVHGDAGARVIAPLLRKRGIRRIDLLVLTHPHEDHFGGAQAIGEEFDIGEILIPAGTDPLAFGEAVARRLGLVRQVKAGERVIKGGVEIAVRGAREAVQRGGPNERCLVLELRHGDVSIWLPGDLESGPAGVVPVPRERGRRAILFLPHHGSHRADPAGWIRAVRPEAVVSQNSNCSGWENLLRSVQFILLENGAFTLRSDGRSWAGEQKEGASLLRLLWRLVKAAPRHIVTIDQGGGLLAPAAYPRTWRNSGF